MDHNSSLTSIGKGYYPKTFMELFCAVEQDTTPHSADSVLGGQGSEFRIQVRCRKCKSQSLYVTSELPVGYQVYQVRITGEDGPHLPNTLRPVPYVEEELAVVANSLQDAHERAGFAHSLPLSGQLTHFYINGELHLDERF